MNTFGKILVVIFVLWWNFFSKDDDPLKTKISLAFGKLVTEIVHTPEKKKTQTSNDSTNWCVEVQLRSDDWMDCTIENLREYGSNGFLWNTDCWNGTAGSYGTHTIQCAEHNTTYRIKSTHYYAQCYKC